MARMMGQYTHNLDQQNRLAVPSKLRDALGEEFVLCVPQNDDRCLFGYALSDWELLMDKLNDQPPSRRLTMQQRFIHLYSVQVETDKQGRFTIPTRFMEAAGFEREVFILGAGKRVEFWAPEEFELAQQRYEEEKEELAVDMPF